ncbi:MAG: PAS domain S-box protein, partial [Ignavibacteriaceae bacterium]|nr:PAS domain S-box protein [Ignavibacteriaceae bacterium]
MKDSSNNKVQLMDTFNKVVDAIPVGIIKIALDGKIQYVNSTFSQLLGYSSNEILQFGFIRHLIIDEYKIETILNTNCSLPEELYQSLKFLTKENGLISLYLKWSPVFNDNNEIESFCAAATNTSRLFEAKGNENEDRERFETRLLIRNSKLVKSSEILRKSLKEKELIQKALLESEERLGAIFESSPSAILLTRDNGKILMANRCAVEMFNLDKNELTNSFINDLLIEADDSTYYGITQSGIQIPVTVNLKMINIFDEYCSVLFLTHKSDDRLTQVETDMTADDESFSVFEHSPKATIVHSENRLLFANNAFAKLLSLENNKIVAGLKYNDIITDRKNETSPFGSQENNPGRINKTLRYEDNVIEVLVTEYPFILKNKKLTASIIELADEKKTDTDKFTQLAQIIEQTNDLISVTNKNGIFEYVNPAFEKSSGYSKEELIGKSSSILKSGRHDDKFYKDLWNTVNAGKAFFGEFYNKRKSGEIYLEAKTISPIRDESGVVTHFVSTAKDITDLKKVQATLYTTELHLRSLLNNIQDVIFYLDDDLNIKYVSPSIS